MKNNGIGKDEVTIISAGVIIEGKVSSNGSIRIDGTINGDVNANSNITVGENGEIAAEVVTVGGKVIGTIIAKEKLTLEAKSTLKGDLTSKILVVEAGAKFDGKSVMAQNLAPRLDALIPENKQPHEKR